MESEKRMTMKRIPETDLNVSEYCLGTMYFGTKVGKMCSFRLLDIFAGMGGNFLDSANKYASWVPGFSGGESETVIGQWLKTRNRPDFIVTSKVGFPYGNIPRSLKSETIISECEKSLERLGCDYIDIYFAHAQDLDTPAEESMEAFYRLVKAGKVRYIGASNHDIAGLSEAGAAAEKHGYSRFVVLQQRYSILQPYVGADFGTQTILTPEQYGYCRSKGITMMAYSPLLGGIYEHDTPEIPIQYDSLHNRKILAIIREYAKETAYGASQLVLSGISRYHGIIPVVAASSEVHLIESLTPADDCTVKEMMEKIGNTDRFGTKY